MEFSWKVEVICVLASFVIYSNTFDAEFVYDDHRAILKNGDVTSTNSLLQIFTNDFWGTPLGDSGSHGSYRPLTTLSFRSNYVLFSDWSGPYHVTNVLLHCISTILFCLMLRIFRFKDEKRIISGLLFSLHPIHTEAVSGLVGRADVISAIFLLASFLVYDKACQTAQDKTLIKLTENQTQDQVTQIQSLSHKNDHKKLKKNRKVRRKKISKKEKTKSSFDLNENPDISSDLVLSKNGSVSDDSTATTDTYDSLTSSNSNQDSTEANFTEQELNKFKEVSEKKDLKKSRDKNERTRDLSKKSRDLDNKMVKSASKENIHKNCGFTKTNFVLFIISCLLALCSLLSKELGYFTLFICVFHDIFIRHKLGIKSGIRAIIFKDPKLNSLRMRSILSILVGLLFCVSRITLPLILSGSRVMTPTFSPSDNPAASCDNLGTRILTFNFLVAQNAKLLVFPNILSFDWSMDSIPLITDVCDVRNLETLGFYVIFLSVLIYSVTLRKRDRMMAKSSDLLDKNDQENFKAITEIKTNTDDVSDDRSHVIQFSFSLLFLSFLSSSNLFFHVGFVIAERVLYIPSIGSCMLLTELIFYLVEKLNNLIEQKGIKTKRKTNQRFLLFTITSLLLLLFANKTWNRNKDWKNEFNLYKSGIPVNPAKSLGNLGNVLRQKGDLKAAEESYIEALKHRSNMADVHYNLGLLYQDTKRMHKALLSYEQAIFYRPSLAIAYLNSGVVLKQLGRTDEAVKMYKKAASLDGYGLKDQQTHLQSQVSALYNLGSLFADQGNHLDAVSCYQKAIDRLRYGYKAHRIYNMLGQSFVQLELYENAEIAFQNSIKQKPDHISAYLTYAGLLTKLNRMNEARQLYKTALTIDKNSDLVHQYYSDFLILMKEYKNAAILLGNYIEKNVHEISYESMFKAAAAYRQASLHERAEHYYRACTKMKPKLASSHMNLGAILHLQGKYLDAKMSYEKALKLKPNDFLIMDNLKKLGKILKNKNI